MQIAGGKIGGGILETRAGDAYEVPFAGAARPAVANAHKKEGSVLDMFAARKRARCAALKKGSART